MTTRRSLLFAMLSLTACKNPYEKSEILPMVLGDFRRVNVENIPAEENPEEYKRSGLKRARRALYKGSSMITAVVYEMGGQAVAFEMVQKWRPEPRKMAFHEGPYFVLLTADQDDRPGMNAMAQQIEQVLKQK